MEEMISLTLLIYIIFSTFLYCLAFSTTAHRCVAFLSIEICKVMLEPEGINIVYDYHEVVSLTKEDTKPSPSLLVSKWLDRRVVPKAILVGWCIHVV